MSVLVKICGLATEAGLDAALAYGADMVGFVFFDKSPRHVSLELATTLGRRTANRACKVLLTVDANNVVTAKPVVLGAVVDGMRVVRSGVGPQDRIIIKGTQMAMPGAKVAPTVGKIAVSADASAPTAQPIAGEATLSR